MSFVLAAQLSGAMTDREAIIDALNRAVLSVDIPDEALLRSAVTDDIETEIMGITTKGMDEFIAGTWGSVSKLTTTHLVSNVRVDITDSQNAKVTASAMAQHVRAGKEFEQGNTFLAGAVYACDVVKVDGVWKLRRWKVKVVWGDGDRSIMKGE